jgi:uncharacterized C2H2 Zn-finger protein
MEEREMKWVEHRERDTQQLIRCLRCRGTSFEEMGLSFGRMQAEGE